MYKTNLDVELMIRRTGSAEKTASSKRTKVASAEMTVVGDRSRSPSLSDVVEIGMKKASPAPSASARDKLPPPPVPPPPPPTDPNPDLGKSQTVLVPPPPPRQTPGLKKPSAEGSSAKYPKYQPGGNSNQQFSGPHHSNLPQVSIPKLPENQHHSLNEHRRLSTPAVLPLATKSGLFPQLHRGLYLQRTLYKVPCNSVF